MQEIHLDLGYRNLPIAIQSKQGDVGRKFKAIITDCDEPYIIPEDAVISVWYEGAGGGGNYTAIDGRPAAVVTGNTAVIELIPQMLACSGGGNLCLVLNDATGNQIGTWNILYVCELLPGIDSPEATDYFTAMSEIARQALTAAEMMELDTTLTQEGKAADAKAVGNALASISLYGLGDEVSACKSVPDLNDATLTTGFYFCGVNSLNTPEGFGSGPLFVLCWIDDAICRQYLMSNDLTQIYTRTFKNDTWKPWEYVNPPMVANNLYQTVERYHNSPVQVYHMHLSSLPSNSIARYSLGPDAQEINDVQLVDVKMVVNVNGAQYINQQILPSGTLSYYVDYTGSDWSFVVETDFDASSITADVTVKYIMDEV